MSNVGTRVVELQAQVAEAQAALAAATAEMIELEAYDSEHFVKLPVKALRDPRLSGNDLKVLATLIDYGDPVRGGAWPSQSTLAQRCGVSRKTVNECVAQLHGSGHLVKENRYQNGGQTSCMYWLAAFKGRPDYKGTASPKVDGGASPTPPSGEGSAAPQPKKKNSRSVHSRALAQWALVLESFKARARGGASADAQVQAGFDDVTLQVVADVRRAMRTQSEKDCQWKFLTAYKEAVKKE